MCRSHFTKIDKLFIFIIYNNNGRYQEKKKKHHNDKPSLKAVLNTKYTKFELASWDFSEKVAANFQVGNFLVN